MPKSSSLKQLERRSARADGAGLYVAQCHEAEHEFLARGRASLENAKKTGEFYPLDVVLDEMRKRLVDRMLKHGCPQKAGD